MNWYETKEWVEHALGLHMDALHIHAGVLGQLLAAAVLRRPLRSPIPWLAVLAALVANEIYDLTFEAWPGEQRQWQYAEGIKDAWNTMLLPTVLLLAARFAPGLLVGRAMPASPGHAGGD